MKPQVALSLGTSQDSLGTLVRTSVKLGTPSLPPSLGLSRVVQGRLNVAKDLKCAHLKELREHDDREWKHRLLALDPIETLAANQPWYRFAVGRMLSRTWLPRLTAVRPCPSQD
jgi:hypothetical protein